MANLWRLFVWGLLINVQDRTPYYSADRKKLAFIVLYMFNLVLYYLADHEPAPVVMSHLRR